MCDTDALRFQLSCSRQVVLHPFFAGRSESAHHFPTPTWIRLGKKKTLLDAFYKVRISLLCSL